jgi:hypothetical protein
MRNDEVRIEQEGWELAGGQTLRSRTIRSFGLHPARPIPPSSPQPAIITRPKREAEYAQVDLQLPHAVLALLLALAQPVGPDVGRRIVLLERLERALEREVDKRVARLVPETERVTVRGDQASATELQEGGGNLAAGGMQASRTARARPRRLARVPSKGRPVPPSPPAKRRVDRSQLVSFGRPRHQARTTRERCGTDQHALQLVFDVSHPGVELRERVNPRLVL